MPMKWQMNEHGVYCDSCWVRGRAGDASDPVDPSIPGQDHCSCCGEDHPDLKAFRQLHATNNDIEDSNDIYSRLGLRERFNEQRLRAAIQMCEKHDSHLGHRIIAILTYERR